MHKKVRFLANERLDFPDLRNISNYPEEEFDILGKHLISDGSNGYVIQGYEVVLNAGLIVNVTIEDLFAVFPNGKLHRRLSSEPQLSIAVADNSTNYIEVQVFSENTNNQTRVFWDSIANAGDGEEFSQNIDTLTQQDVRLVVNQVAFSGDLDKVPVAVVVASSGIIERIHDNYKNQILSGAPADPVFTEDLLFRLNDQDNDGNTDDYNFGAPRTDTEINNLKEFVNANLTQIKHILGDGRTTGEGPNNDWFDAVPTNLFASNQDRNAWLVDGGNISWNQSTNQLIFDTDLSIQIGGVSGSNVIPTSESPISLVATGSCAYVSIDRDAIATSNLTVSTDLIDNVPTDKDVFIIAMRRGDDVVMVDGTLIEGGDTVKLGAAKDSAIAPVGSIIPFYDFNGLVSFDTNHWAYCDGSVISDSLSPLDGETLPDLSGRYLVGFGTEGGGDIDTVAWATAAVGNSNHQINISHSHTVNSHTHEAGSLRFPWLHHEQDIKAVGAINTWDSDGNEETELIRRNDETADPANNGEKYMINDFSTWDAWTQLDAGIGSTGSSSPGTDSQLSGSQSIQPRSVRVRYIMRKR